MMMMMMMMMMVVVMVSFERVGSSKVKKSDASERDP